MVYPLFSVLMPSALQIRMILFSVIFFFFFSLSFLPFLLCLAVYCSAGVGRTGTLIVIDTMITQAKLEGKMDVFNYIIQLRKQRNFIVQTEVCSHRITAQVLMTLKYASSDGTRVLVCVRCYFHQAFWSIYMIYI